MFGIFQYVDTAVYEIAQEARPIHVRGCTCAKENTSMFVRGAIASHIGITILLVTIEIAYLA